MTASPARRIGARLRGDLHVSHQRRDGADHAVIKDPLQLRFFEMDWEDYRLATRVREGATAAEIVGDWQRAFPEMCAEHTVTELEAHAERLCATVRQLGLAEGSGVKRRKDSALTWSGWAVRWLRRISAPMFLRLRLFDPDPWLTRAVESWRWLFSAPMAAAAGVFVFVSALVCVGDVGAMEFHPEWFRSWGNLAALYVGILALKVIHECGHALVCKALGGHVHEVGVQLLAFHPTFFVDVSDTWMWPDRRRRIAVAAAGFGAEMIAAAALYWLWTVLSPGFARDLCLHLMFIAGVSAVLFNANPLMRYDGYHMLADFVREPHLRQKAFATVSRAVRRWVLGPQRVPRSRERKRWLFAGYGVLSTAYLVWMAFIVGAFLERVLAPFGLELLGRIVLLAWLGSMFVPVLAFAAGVAREVARLPVGERLRPMAIASALALLIGFAVFVPLPVRVEREGVIEAPAAGVVRASQVGVVREILVREGDRVRAGQLLVRIENRSLALAQARAGIDLELSKATLLSALGTSRAEGIDAGTRRLNQARANEAQSQRRSEELDLVSPCDGVVLTRHLDRAQGRMVRPGDEVLRVAADTMRECLLPLTEKEARRVKEGARAEFRSRAFPDLVIRGTVASAPLRRGESEAALDVLDPISAADATHLARIVIESADARLRPGLTGRARLDCGRVSAVRWLSEALLDAIHLRHRL